MLGLHRNGSLMAVDEKTASQLGATWSGNWDVDSQFTGYIAGARSYSVPVVGAVIRGISILKTSYGSAEAIVYRPAWEISRWYAQLLRDVEGMVRAWREAKALSDRGERWDLGPGLNWALDKNACSSYGGCMFKSLCKVEDMRNYIPIEYIHREWKPLERTSK
jgi:hypothetical protein